ncbi:MULTISPECIES: enoyl-CoA hydratase/isomerase family protein [Brevibacterium]|uniref:Enoyl-CoA hydratase n=1 Tax=Brevibacterium salitolerans TaxID=1403566 RepID=A0ABN2WM24_9MICO|nr:enoyl-CoA hydratase/isomerase family protein [Brevibacterium sp.]
MSLVSVIDSGNMCTVRLERPERKNALNFDLVEQLCAAVEAADARPRIRLIEIRGAGTGFCAGDDIRGMGTEEHPLPSDPFVRGGKGYVAVVRCIRRCRKPVIANLHGFAIGAGLLVALAADLITAEPTTKVAAPFARLGIAAGALIAESGVPHRVANEMVLGGRRLDARRLYDLGVVNHIGEEEQREGWIREIAEYLSTAAAPAVRAVKHAGTASGPAATERSCQLEEFLLAGTYGNPNYAEGKAAYLEKREPDFTDTGTEMLR